MYITKDQIEKGRKEFDDYMRGRQGSFYTSLFQAIAHSIGENTRKLAEGFPGEVYAYVEYVYPERLTMFQVEGEPFMALEEFMRIHPDTGEGEDS